MKLILENWKNFVQQQVEDFLPDAEVRSVNMIGSSALSPEEQAAQDLEKYGYVRDDSERDIDIEVQVAGASNEDVEAWAFSEEAEELEATHNYDVQLRIVEGWREYMGEIEDRPSLQGDPKKDSLDMVLWAKEGADKVSTKKVKHDGLQIQIANMGDHTRLIAYLENEQPVGYLAIEPFKNGVKIGTLAVGKQYQGKGVAKRMYDYIIQNHNVYSGDSQTPESKGLWNNFFTKKYNVKAINVKTGKEITDPNMVYTKEGEPSNNVYLYIPRGG